MNRPPSGFILQTDRLVIRELILADAPFVFELLNEPAFLRFIGDKGVRDIPSAEKYLTDGPLASYAKHGFGLWLVALKDGGTPVGMCGPLKRDTLDHPDLGYAILARFAGRGYTFEAATATLAHARNVLKLPKILAVTAQKNPGSIALLGKLGYTFERMTTLPGQKEPSRLFVPGD